MSPDLKQTLPASETLDLSKTQDDKETALSTTLIQPTSRPRPSELTRTRYWEKRASDAEPRKQPNNCGNTRIGLGPDDPLVQAVRAVKLQLMQATQPVAPQPTAAAPKPEPPVQKPKRDRKPLLIAAAAALSIMAIAALTTKHTPAATRAPASLVKPAPAKAPSEPAPIATAPQSPEPVDPSAASERAAVDALFAGDYALAKRVYQALAQAHPTQPAFAEAARILSRIAEADPEAE